jgi:hypothetical protein
MNVPERVQGDVDCGGRSGGHGGGEACSEPLERRCIDAGRGHTGAAASSAKADFVPFQRRVSNPSALERSAIRSKSTKNSILWGSTPSGFVPRSGGELYLIEAVDDAPARTRPPRSAEDPGERPL